MNSGALCRRLHALGVLLLALVAAQPGTTAAQTQPPVAPRFDIQRFVVEGNTLLPQSAIDKAVAPFTGKDRDFGDIQRSLEALQDVYLKGGYNAVRVLVPEQDIRTGTVRLQVVEARLASVRVENNRFFDTANVRASLPALKEGTSPNTRAIGENAQLANDSPAKQVSVALQASDKPGQVDATVRVVDENPTRYSVFADNTGTPSTGYYRTGVGFQHANVFNSDQVLSAQAITSPDQPSDVLIAGVGYHIPIYGWQGTMDFVGGYSDVNSGTVQDLFTVSGSGSVFAARYTQYLPRIDTYDQKLALGWDWRAYHNNVGLVGVSGSLVPDVTVQPLSLTYTGRFSQLGQDLSFYLAAAQNVPGGTDGGQDAFTAQRAGASANYLIYRAGAVYTKVLPRDYRLRAAANGQYTNYLLVSGEQFGMGGVDSVRGFYERETANDIGNRFSLEGYTPDFGAGFGNGWTARALAFTDMAHGRDNNPPQNANNGLASVGLGLRVNQGKSLALRLDWAYVTNAAGSRSEGSNRLHFAVAYSF